VIQTAFLGDVVLTTPLLSVLAERHGPVDVVTTPAAASLLEHHPAVHEVLRYDKHGSARGWRGFRRLGAELRSRRYERVYLPHRSARSAALALWTGAEQRIGFADSPAALTYSRRIRRPREGHEVERLLALADWSPAQAAPPVSLGLAPTDHAAAGSWLASHAVGPDFIAVAPGSIAPRSSSGAARMSSWPTPLFVLRQATPSALPEPSLFAAPRLCFSGQRCSSPTIRRRCIWLPP
jgi:heptosyltransferase-2